MLKRYKIADGWAEMKETTSQDARWVKWADLQAYFGREEMTMLLDDATAADKGNASEDYYVGEMQNTINAEAYRRLADKIRALLPESS